MITCNTISAIKANRLYWLGRYTERVYISLHLLRRYYDKMIDGKPKEYEEYYQKLDISNPYPDKESFRIGYMYDDKNPCSLMSGLTAATDNAIVLREEIMSETLSYIELSLSYIRKSAEKKDDNITDLQPITDYLLAFWGSFESLKLCAETEEGIFDPMILEHLNELLREDVYDCFNLGYKSIVLKYINHLVLV